MIIFWIYMMIITVSVFGMILGSVTAVSSVIKVGYDYDNKGKNMFMKSAGLGYLISFLYYFLMIL